MVSDLTSSVALPIRNHVINLEVKGLLTITTISAELLIIKFCCLNILFRFADDAVVLEDS